MEVKETKTYQKRLSKPASVKAKKSLAKEILNTLSGLKSDINELKLYI